jgi:hypothetical protein
MHWRVSKLRGDESSGCNCTTACAKIVATVQVTSFQRTRFCPEFVSSVETVEVGIRFPRLQRVVGERDVLAEESWSGRFATKAQRPPLHEEQTCLFH